MRVRSADLGGGPKGVLGSEDGGALPPAVCTRQRRGRRLQYLLPDVRGGSALAEKEMRPSGPDPAPRRPPPLPRPATASGEWDEAAPPEDCGRSQL